jgi:membrane associated rhomboid family serine protease
MPIVGQILSALLSAFLAALFGLLGRWIQLHPERIVPKGQFVGRDSSGARLFRAQMVLMGTFMVFGGTFGVVSSLLSLLTFRSAILQLLARLIGLVVGVLAAIRVRKEVRSQPGYVSTSPYGWWP